MPYIKRYLVLGFLFLAFILSWIPPTVMPVMQSRQAVPTLVIDPGHGGEDGGAVGLHGEKESELNLDISLRLSALCKLYGVRCLLTRDSETLQYPLEAKTISQKKTYDQRRRLRLIRDCPSAILFSIHQNQYPSPEIAGIQVFYGHRAGDRELGEQMQKLLLDTLRPAQRRMATEIDESIYLMRECDCTSILIECGFISGREDIALLMQEAYRMKLAACLTAGYMNYIEQAKN